MAVSPREAPACTPSVPTSNGSHNEFGQGRVSKGSPACTPVSFSMKEFMLKELARQVPKDYSAQTAAISSTHCPASAVLLDLSITSGSHRHITRQWKTIQQQASLNLQSRKLSSCLQGCDAHCSPAEVEHLSSAVSWLAQTCCHNMKFGIINKVPPKLTIGHQASRSKQDTFTHASSSKLMQMLKPFKPLTCHVHCDWG